jgi:hypothetical protein
MPTSRGQVMDNIRDTMRAAELSRAADKAFERRGFFDPVYRLADALDNLKRGTPTLYAAWPSPKNG